MPFLKKPSTPVLRSIRFRNCVTALGWFCGAMVGIIFLLVFLVWIELESVRRHIFQIRISVSQTRNGIPFQVNTETLPFIYGTLVSSFLALVFGNSARSGYCSLSHGARLLRNPAI